MARVIVITQSLEGQTEKIANHIVEVLGGEGVSATAVPLDNAPSSLSGYRAAILGGSIHLGHHGRELAAYAKAHAAELRAMPSAFFSVSLSMASEHEAEHLAVQKIVNAFLDETGWHPGAVAMFGGALKYTRYGFIKRRMMRSIARKEGGPTDTSQDHDLTDWEAVDEFARDIAAHLPADAGQ